MSLDCIGKKIGWGIRMPIRAGIVGTFQVDFDRDNAPEPGVEKDDTKYGLKLGYEW